MNNRDRMNNKTIKLIVKRKYRYFYSIERKMWIWRKEVFDLAEIFK